MKKVLLLGTLAAVLFACQGKDEFVLEGTVKGVDGKKIILQKQDEKTGIMLSKDTVVIEKGKFIFEGKILEPSIYLLAIEGVQAKSFLVLEHGNIDIEINKDSVYQNKISGTYNNEQLTEYNKKAMAVQNKVKAFEKTNGAKMQAARAQNDNATVKKLMDDYMLLVGNVKKEMTKMTETYITEHPKSFISALLIQSYFNTYIPDLKKIKTLYDGLDSDLKKTKAGKDILKRLEESKTVAIGQIAPEFAAPNPEGKPTSMRQSMGKVTVIDFWASWCPPCRAQNKYVVEMYNELHAKGLNIIGVSLDKTGDAEKWKEAIAKDQLTWPQVSNLKHWEDPVAKLYGVKNLPSLFILNQKGVVVAKDLHGVELKAKIEQLLAAN